MENAKMKVVITFKEEERWLYDEICSHSSRAGYVKDILKLSHKQQTDQKSTVVHEFSEKSILNGISSLLK